MKPEPQVFFLRRKDFYFFWGGGGGTHANDLKITKLTHANGLKNKICPLALEKFR